MLVIPFVSVHVAEPPRITSQLQELTNTAQLGECVKLTIQAIGTKPVNYQWQWKALWQPCDPEWCNGAILTIPNTQKCNEGSYRCVISNSAGTQTSNLAELIRVGKNPAINVSIVTVITINCP